MDDIKLFVRFLKKNNAYEAFLFNQKHSKYKSDQYYEKRLKSNQIIPHDFLLDAFPWANSKEGEEYWYELHMEWQFQLDSIKNAIIAQW